MSICVAIMKKQITILTFKQIKMKNSAYTPFLPVISRFSPPWDADGWYYVGRNFSKRSKIYSNAEVYPVKFNAQKYKGADFIVTFDSVREGKDDHQECDFYVERNCTVAVAFDKSAAETDSMPEWIADFTDTETEIITNEKSITAFLREALKPASI